MVRKQWYTIPHEIMGIFTHAQTVDIRPFFPSPTWPGYEANIMVTCVPLHLYVLSSSPFLFTLVIPVLLHLCAVSNTQVKQQYVDGARLHMHMFILSIGQSSKRLTKAHITKLPLRAGLLHAAWMCQLFSLVPRLSPLRRGKAWYILSHA